MKRVLAVLLCLLCAMLLLVACGDNNTDTDNQGNNNTDNQGHTHTYKTNEEWTKDAQGHWYDATCDCEDAPITKLNHTDANNDGACDVCTFTNHEHEYTEDWTADCTNHWNAADCGHTVAGINVGAHVDEDADGRCDVCNYIIEDLHEHIYATEWTYGDGYHWHAALCEHKVEVADKAACNVNAAGVCTVCDAKIKEIDKTNILAVIEAAVANNYKIISGDVLFEQLVYAGSESNGSLTLSNSATDGVYFVLGNGNSYYFLKDYDAAGNLIGGEQQWYEVIDEDNIFAVKMDVNNYTLDRVMGDPAKLNGYNYIPGAVLSGYDNTNTLAQTIYNFYDMMTKGDNVSDAKTNYDAEKNIYTFSFTRFTVNELTSGGEVYDTVLYLFDVSVEFTVNDDMIINSANIQVKEYSRLDAGNFSDDLVYDKETGLVTKSDNASPTCYNYIVGQTSGKRTYTSPYPRASLLPVAFDFYYVTEHEFPSGTEWVIYAEELIGDTITIPAGTYAYFHLGNPYPSTSSFDFLETSDFTFEFVNNNPDMVGRAWYMDPGSVDAMLNGYSAYTQCLKLKLRDAGTYTVTIGFGGLNKVFTLVIPGEEIPNVEPDTENKLNVLITDNNTYDVDYKEYKATLGEGKYTFTIPAGLGAVIDGESYPRVDFNETADGGTFTVELEADEVITIYFGAATKNVVFAVDVAYEACDVEDDVVDPIIPGPGDPTTTDIKGTYTGSNITVVIDETNVTFTNQKGNQTVARYEIVDGAVVLHNDTYGTIWASYLLAVNLTNGAVTSVVYNGNTISVAPAGGDDSGDEPGDIQGSGTEDDPYIITAGDYTAEYAGNGALGFVYYSFTANTNGIITVTSKFDGTIWLTLGNESNEGEAQSLSAFVPVGSEVIIAVADWDEQPDSIPFTVSFEEKASDSFEALVGTWYAKSEDIFTILYTLTINADGKGTFSYDMGYGANEYNVTYVFVNGNSVTVGYSSGSLACTFDGTTFACQLGVMQDAFTFQTTPIEDGGNEGGDDPDEPTYEEDPLKEAVLGMYSLGGYYASVYYFDGYYVNVYDDNWTVDLYFTFDVIDNEDGTYKLVLTHEEREIELGSDKVDEILALDFIVTPEVEEEEDKTPIDALNGTYIDNALNGFNVGFYYDGEAWVYFFNVYGGTQDLYYYAIPTENEDGSVSLALTLCEDHWSYYGNPVTDEYELNGKTVIATPNGDSWTFAIEGQAPVVTPDGSFNNPYALEENNTCEFPGGWNYIFYSYTAAANGTLTITVVDNGDLYWSYGYGEYEMEQVQGLTTDISLTAGKTVYIGMSTNSAAAGTISFTATFEESTEEPIPAEPDGSSDNPFTFVMGENSLLYKGYAYAWAFYKFTATEDGVLTITMTSTNFDLGYGSDPMRINGSQNSPLAINLTAGQTIWVGITTASGSSSDTPITFTASFGNGEGDDVTEEAREVDLVLGNNNVNAENITFVYTADAAVKLEIAVGNYVMNNVDVTYSVNGGTAIAIAQASSVKVDLNQGDVLKIFATTKGGYVSINATEVVNEPEEPEGPTLSGAGTSSNPYIITELPLTLTFQGKHDFYYSYTATEDIVITINAPAGLVSDTGAVKDANNNYVVNLAAGQTLKMNIWTMSNNDVEYVYTITGAAPVVTPDPEQPGEGGDEGGTSSAVTYYGSNGSRGMRVIIDTVADTLTITRAASGYIDNFEIGSPTTYNLVYSEVLAKANNGVTGAIVGTNISSITFAADGTIEIVTWGGANYTDFVKQ